MTTRWLMMKQIDPFEELDVGSEEIEVNGSEADQ